MPTQVARLQIALRANADDFGVQLDDSAVKDLGEYYELLLKWTDRLHLVAPCSPEEFATRHVLESLLLLRHLRPNAHALDVGSGGGLPVIPCLIARSDLSATLIESSERKGVFLREALRGQGVSNRADVVVARFEDDTAPKANYVTSRALDRFRTVLPRLIEWSPADSTLLLFGGHDLRRLLEALLPAVAVERIPHSERRFLLMASRPS